jgi:undecaprenyl diphosphate synthase
VASVRRTVEEAARLHLEQLTLYCLSSENWKRPQRELDFLMHLLEQYMIEERATIMRQNIAVRVIGRREGIPAATLAEMDKTVAMSAANTGTRLCLAINYGGRMEIVDAVRNGSPRSARASSIPRPSTNKPSPTTSIPPACPTPIC